MSWLTYGLDPENALISIQFVPRGRTSLRCPYCRGELTAKKGSKKEHHFAHTLQTCRAVAERDANSLPLLPLYDKFNLHLSGTAFEELRRLWNRYGTENLAFSKPDHQSLISQWFVEWNPYRRRTGGYEFTKLGKIPVGALSLRLFNDEQQDLIQMKLADLKNAARKALEPTRFCCDTTFPEKLMDLRLYRAQMKRILSNHLYYLKIQADGQILYKIGVTRRAIEERMAEVEADLRSHFQSVSIEVLGTWAHRGNVELYFKYRYSQFNRRIGELTEYFQFDDPADAKKVLSDLRRMKPKELTQEEIEILNDEPTELEKQVEAVRQDFLKYEKLKARSQAIQVGMQRAAQWGTHVGRPKGGEFEAAFLEKPSSQRVIAALKEGLSLRKAADRADVAVNTVRKVKALMERNCNE